MSGASLFAEIVIVAGLTVAGSWLIFMIATAQTMRREDERAHGDVPHLPDDAKRAATNKGGGTAIGQRPFTQASDIAHRNEGPTR